MSLSNESAKLWNSLRNTNLQDLFLSICISEQIEVDLFLQTEASQRGVIEAFDNWVILLRSNSRRYLIYKTAILSMTPVELDKTEAIIQAELNGYNTTFKAAKIVMSLEEELSQYKAKQNDCKSNAQYLALKQTLKQKLQKPKTTTEYDPAA